MKKVRNKTIRYFALTMAIVLLICAQSAIFASAANHNYDKTVTVEVSAVPANGGTVTGGGEHKVVPGYIAGGPALISVKLEATPNTGWVFDGWYASDGVLLGTDPALGLVVNGYNAEDGWYVNIAGGYHDKLMPYEARFSNGDSSQTDPGQEEPPTITPPGPNTLSDWAEELVNAALETGLVPEPLQGDYKQATTRAEFCSLAVELYETVMGKEITERIKFDDTDDVNVEKMAAVKVVDGTGANKFEPDTQLTREQAATMLARLANAVGTPLPMSAPTFSDNDRIHDYAYDAVGQCQAAKIMNGVDNNMFAPRDPYTREQSIMTIMRLYNYLRPKADEGFLSADTYDEITVYASDERGYVSVGFLSTYESGMLIFGCLTEEHSVMFVLHPGENHWVCEVFTVGIVNEDETDRKEGILVYIKEPVKIEEVNLNNIDEMKAIIDKYAPDA